MSKMTGEKKGEASTPYLPRHDRLMRHETEYLLVSFTA